MEPPEEMMPDMVTPGVYHGDMRILLETWPEACVDAVVTDPPHGLGMDKWDDEIAHDPETWRPVLRVLRPGRWLVAKGAARTYHRLACAVESAGFIVDDMVVRLNAGNMPKSRRKLKNAHEPIVVAYRPGEVPHTFRIDDCRVLAPDQAAYEAKCASVIGCPSSRTKTTFGEFRQERRDSSSPLGRWPSNVLVGDGIELGDEERFFYCARASAAERGDSRHPTKTPLVLVRYLVRLVSSPGDLVLDPFCGSGSVGVGAASEGRSFVGVERDVEYVIEASRSLGGYCPF